MVVSRELFSFLKFSLVNFKNLCVRILRFTFTHMNRLRLHNHDFSIIASDCIGGVTMRNLGVRFDSPTVNLYFTLKDFLKFCGKLEFYLSHEIMECTDSGKDFPAGTIGTGDDMVKIYFMHYENFALDKEKNGTSDEKESTSTLVLHHERSTKR